MISLFIPTMNRSDFLLRLLKYCRDVDFKGPIYIGDSSHPAEAERAQEAIRNLRDDLNIVYRQYPGVNGVHCVQELLKLIETPYSAFVADDDFMVPAALERCADFLEANPDYSAAHGLGALIGVESNAVHGRLTGYGYYKQPVIEDGSASQRLTSLLQDYTVTLFSVHRVQTWRAMYKNAGQAADWKVFGGELMQSCRSVIEGKVKQLDCLHVVRQVANPQSAPADTDGRPTTEADALINMSATSPQNGLQWVTSRDWLPSYEIFRDCLSGELARQDGITMNESLEVVEKAFWSYLERRLSRDWQARYNKVNAVSSQSLKRAALTVPGVRQAWRTFRSFLPGQPPDMSIPAMLNRALPYHADFMPIYRALTRP